MELVQGFQITNVNLASGTEAAPVKITFEEISATGPEQTGQVSVFHQYDRLGITFNDPVLLDYSKSTSPWIYQAFAHSGTKAIVSCYGKEVGCSTPIIMTFTTPQKHVGLWVGYSTNLNKAKNVILTALTSRDAKPNIITTTAILQPSTSPVAIRTYIQITAMDASISSVQVSFAPDQYGMVDNQGLAVDDIDFDSLGPMPPCISKANPVVTLAQSPRVQVVRWNNFSLQGTVNTTAPLESARLTIVGSGGTNSIDLLSDKTISHDGGAYSINNKVEMLFPGFNTVTVSVKDCKNSGEKSTEITFQPCDATISPKVTIFEPNPAAINNFVSKTTFRLNGKIESPGKLFSVVVTVTGEMPYPQSHQFTIQPDSQNAFDLILGSENLYEGNNSINIMANTNNGCSGEASTKVACEKRIHSSSRIIHISDIHCTSRSNLVDVNIGNIVGDLVTGLPVGNPTQGDWQNTFAKCNQIVSFLINNSHRLGTHRIVITGDLVDGAEDYYFKTIAKNYLLNPLTSFGFDVTVVPGNHDYFALGNQFTTSSIADGRTAFFNAFSSYSKASAPDAYPVDLDLGDGNHLILLDALKGHYDVNTASHKAQGNIGEKQLNWLRNTLPMYQQDRKAGKKIAIALHHSPFETDESLEITDAAEFLGVISNNIDALMFGHVGPPHKFYGEYALTYNIPVITGENIDKMSSTGYPISVIDLNNNIVEVYSTSGGLSGAPTIEKR
jgi:hypothetical protein